MELKEAMALEWDNKIETRCREIVENYDEKSYFQLYQLAGDIIEKYAMKSLDVIVPLSLPSTRNIILDIYKNTTNKDILDAGCGPNPYVSIELAKKSNRIVSMDISKGIIRTARMFAKKEKLNNLTFIIADLKYLPFKESHFDIIICSDTIEHIINPDAAIKEMADSIKRNGEILFTIPNRWDFITLLARFKDILKGKKKPEREYYISTSHFKEYTYPEVKKILKNKLTVSKHYFLGWKGGWKTYVINNIIAMKPFRSLSSHIVIKCQKVENFKSR
jgi:2-polyprenyl-3-methyl-5-hydroxy-6-metoxy-1,4-benzoquinol methylase